MNSLSSSGSSSETVSKKKVPQVVRVRRHIMYVIINYMWSSLYCLCVHVCVHTYICVCVCVCIEVLVHVSTSVCICTSCMCVYVHITYDFQLCERVCEIYNQGCWWNKCISQSNT